MERLKIRVTRDDIRQGKNGETGWCPIARSLRRTIEAQPGEVDIKSVSVMPGYCTVRYTITRHFATPKQADTFIERFDGHEKVQPTAITLRG